jgi:hypothetical protein
MKKILVCLFALISLHSFAQDESVINDPNAEKRELKESFSGISVTDGIELYLTQGKEESIAVSASDAKYFERYRTEVDNGILSIYYDNKGVNWTGNEKRKLKAYVSFKTLEKLNASGGARVQMKSKLSSPKLEATFTSGSRFTGDVDIDQLDLAENSGASMEVNGRAARLKVEVSSGAILKGYDLVSEYCDARASSGGAVRISVNKELTVKASSGGGIHYKGDAVVKDMNVSSGGSVKKG